MDHVVTERKRGGDNKVAGIIKRLMDEKKAGTGPHSGKGGPLVKNRKQIIAIAFSKMRRGNG